MRRVSLSFPVAAAVIAAAFSLPAAPALAAEPPGLSAAAAALTPGRHVWISAPSADGPVAILVSLGAQRAFVFKGSKLVGISTVSSGAPGYDTPTGTFTILEKDEDHRSNLYDDAPMPYMQRLTWDGVALHAGKVRPEPASHGCVRLPLAFARKLFDMTTLGATVTITDETLSTPEEAVAALGIDTGTEVAAAD